MKQRKADMAYRSRAHRHPAHSPHTRRPRARPTPAGRKGSDSLGRQQNEYVESWLNNAERNESRPAHKSGSRAPTDRSTALITSAPSLPTHPPRLGPRRAISGDLGPRRAISGDLALSRAISGPRRAISGDLGASLARRHTCSKRKEVGGRRSRPIQSAVVAGFLAPGSSPDGCCAGQQTIGRRDDAPSGTLPPPPGYCRTSALSGGIFPSRFLGPRQRRRTSRPPTCAAITAVIVGAAPLGARACPACPPAKAGAKANSTAKAGARAKSTAWLVPRLKGSPLSLSSLSTLCLSTFSLSLP